MRGDDRGQLGKAHLGEGRHIATVATSTGGVAECEVLMKIVVRRTSDECSGLSQMAVRNYDRLSLLVRTTHDRNLVPRGCHADGMVPDRG